VEVAMMGANFGIKVWTDTAKTMDIIITGFGDI